MLSSTAVERGGLRFVLRNTVALMQHEGEVILGDRVALSRRFPEPARSSHVVLFGAATSVVEDTEIGLGHVQTLLRRAGVPHEGFGRIGFCVCSAVIQTAQFELGFGVVLFCCFGVVLQGGFEVFALVGLIAFDQRAFEQAELRLRRHGEEGKGGNQAC